MLKRPRLASLQGEAFSKNLPMNHRLTAYLLMLVVSITWGVAAPVIKFTLSYFPPLIFLTYRFAISSLVALAYFGTGRNHLPRKPGNWWHIGLYSFFAVTLGLGILFLGADKTTSLSVGLLSTVAPIMIVAAGALFLRERVTLREKVGITIALLGTLVTVSAPLFSDHGGLNWGSLEGNLLVVLSMVFDVAAGILAKVIVREHTKPATLTHLSFVVGLLTIGPLAFFFHGGKTVVASIVAAPVAGHMGVLYMALLSGTLAYTLRNRAIKTIEVGEAALFAYLYPLWAAPLAVLWLGEKITTPFLVGGLIIALGVVIAEHKKHQLRKKLRRRHRKRTL